MHNNSFKHFVSYLENLAVCHKDIQHKKDDQIHFIRLDTDELNNKIKSVVGFPVVCLDRYSANITGSPDNFKKRRGITLMILDRVADSKDYDRIHEVWDNCEVIADDFIARMYSDWKENLIPAVRDLDITSAEYELGSVQSLSLFGVIVTIELQSVFCSKPRTGAFG